MIYFYLTLVVLLISVYFDIRSKKIPNVLILITSTIFLLIRMSFDGLEGVLSSFCLLILVFLLLVPVYAIQGIGAGDVKLIMAISIFMQPLDVFWFICISLIYGGTYGVIIKLIQKQIKGFLAVITALKLMILLKIPLEDTFTGMKLTFIRFSPIIGFAYITQYLLKFSI